MEYDRQGTGFVKLLYLPTLEVRTLENELALYYVDIKFKVRMSLVWSPVGLHVLRLSSLNSN